MDDQQFEMMMQMHRDTHDKIDSVREVVQEASANLRAHIKEDEVVHKVVERHTTYWKIFTGGATSLLGYLGIIK